MLHKMYLADSDIFAAFPKKQVEGRPLVPMCLSHVCYWWSSAAVLEPGRVAASALYWFRDSVCPSSMAAASGATYSAM